MIALIWLLKVRSESNGKPGFWPLCLVFRAREAWGTNANSVHFAAKYNNLCFVPESVGLQSSGERARYICVSSAELCN